MRHQFYVFYLFYSIYISVVRVTIYQLYSVMLVNHRPISYPVKRSIQYKFPRFRFLGSPRRGATPVC